jgi:hypothetical protein
MIRALRVALLAAVVAPQAQAREREHASLRRNVERGDLLPLSEIERRILPSLPGHQYLGPEFDPASRTYRLKFIRNGRVLWLDVDGRSGRVIGRASP